MGVIFLKQPAAQLSEAKNLLQDFDHIPRVQRLLEVIDKKLGKVCVVVIVKHSKIVECHCHLR
jgi:hypothetical protein